MVRSRLIPLLVLSVWFSLFSQPTAYSSILFDDGGIHTINSDINDSVEIYNFDSPFGDPTTVNVVTNGSIAEWLSVDDTSIVNVSGGLIGDSLSAYGGGQVNISDGAIGGYLTAWHNSDIVITGGAIGDMVEANNNSRIDIYGGVLNGDISAYYNSIITIYGSGFNYPLGPISDPSGTLTGTLSNGDPLNVNFGIYNNGTINLVPEPATLFLLGLGGLISRKKRS